MTSEHYKTMMDSWYASMLLSIERERNLKKKIQDHDAESQRLLTLGRHKSRFYWILTLSSTCDCVR
jgi:hypothetical protein